MRICFDMDGTIADFYGCENWLDDLCNEDVAPYENAKPLFNFSTFARLLHKAQQAGIEIYIISWTAKNAIPEFINEIALTKKEWLKKHLPSVEWNETYFIEYGEPKNQYCLADNDILFDDEITNREQWSGKSYDVPNLLETLKNIIKGVSENEN